MFKVGDRVVRVKFNPEEDTHKGTVKHTWKIPSAYPYLVEYDNYIGGHDGGVPDIKGKDGHCWWENDCTIRKLDEQTQGMKKIKKGGAKMEEDIQDIKRNLDEIKMYLTEMTAKSKNGERVDLDIHLISERIWDIEMYIESLETFV